MSSQRHEAVAEAYKAVDVVLRDPHWNQRERKRLLGALDVLDAAVYQQMLAATPRSRSDAPVTAGRSPSSTREDCCPSCCHPGLTCDIDPKEPHHDRA